MTIPKEKSYNNLKYKEEERRRNNQRKWRGNQKECKKEKIWKKNQWCQNLKLLH